MDMTTASTCDSYEDQLRSLFVSCDPTGSDALDESALRSLCHKLELSPPHDEALIDQLTRHGGRTVSFDGFKDGLIVFLEDLSKATGTRTAVQDLDQGPRTRTEQPKQREVEPRIVFRNKKYGRKSRPSSVDAGSSEEEEEGGQKVPPSPRSCKSPSPPVDDGIHMDGDRLSPTEGFALRLGKGDTEQEYLRSIWTKLGIGQDGFLDRKELAQVCECIGMEKLADEIVDQLFLKLDMDNDGRVAFEDLLSLFQSGNTFSTASSPADSESSGASDGEDPMAQVSSSSSLGKPPRRPFNHASPINESLKQSKDHYYFSALDLSESGFASADSVLEYWDSLGITNGQQVLHDLGLSYAKTIDLKILTSILEDELEQCTDIMNYQTAKAAISTCQNEVRILKSSIENVRFERDKLRVDLTEANQRATLLAQDVDDQNARIERASQQRVMELEQKYCDQLKDIQDQLSFEREQHLSLSHELDTKNRQFTTQLSEHGGRLKDELTAIKAENHRLERENSDLSRRLNETESLNTTLQREIASLCGVRERLLELEQTRSATANSAGQIEELQTINKDLKDQLDELQLQLEATKADLLDSRRSSSSRSDADRVSSSIGQKRKGQEAEQQTSPTTGKLRKFPTTESLGAELGDRLPSSTDPRCLEESLSSLESVDDSLIIQDESNVVVALRQQVREVEQRAEQRLKDLTQQFNRDLDDVKSNSEREVTKLKEIVETTEKELQQVLQHNSSLKTSLSESLSANADLSTGMKQIQDEMKSVQQRLQNALSQLTNAKDKVTKDEEKITGLQEKCSQLEDRLRESITIGHTNAAAKSPSSEGSTENIQVIPVRHSSSPEPSLSSSSSQRSSSPCVSKVFLSADHPTSNIKTIVRKTSEPLAPSHLFRPVVTQSHSVNNIPQPSSLPAYTNSIKRSRSTTENERAKVQVFQLEQHCKNLEGELDHVKDEILRILSDKTNTNKENESLRHYVKAYSEVIAENEFLKKELGLNKTPQPPKSPTASISSSSGESGSSDPHQYDRTSPDGQEFDLDQHCQKHQPLQRLSGSRSLNSDDLEGLKLEEVQKQLEEERRKNDSTKEELEKKIKELEESLELMKSEFENMEDYWQGKLDEERKFYEKQLKMSDVHFKELEIKMKEYEELLMTSEAMKDADDTDKLSTIDETVSLECQVTELEEEICDLRSRISGLAKEKEEAVKSVEDFWKTKLEKEKSAHDMTASLLEKKNAEFEKRFDQLREELDKVKSDRAQLQSSYTRDVLLLQDSCLHMHDRFQQQPSSLPPDLLTATTSDLHRLRELRRLVQAECDQLLTRKERLKEELVRPTVSSGSMSLDASFRYPGSASGGGSVCTSPREETTSALSSVARAYKNVLEDIKREKTFVEREVAIFNRVRSAKNSGKETNDAVKTLSVRLKHLEQRCQHLQDALTQQQQNTQRILEETRKKHKSEIENLEGLIDSSQEMLKTQLLKYTEQMERLVQSDILVKQLYAENETLVKAIETIENSFEIPTDFKAIFFDEEEVKEEKVKEEPYFLRRRSH